MQFLSSRPNTPMPFVPRHGKTLSQGFALDNGKENGHLAIPKPTSTVQSGPDAVSVLEVKANGVTKEE
jgi:hypothetical protein